MGRCLLIIFISFFIKGKFIDLQKWHNNLEVNLINGISQSPLSLKGLYEDQERREIFLQQQSDALNEKYKMVNCCFLFCICCSQEEQRLFLFELFLLRSTDYITLQRRIVISHGSRGTRLLSAN